MWAGRSPLGDVICYDLYLFTASVDTFKRKKKVSTRTGIGIQNKSLWMGLLGAKDTNTDTHTHTQTCAWTQMHKHTCAHSHTNNISVQTQRQVNKWRAFKEWSLFKQFWFKCHNKKKMLYLALRKVCKSLILVYRSTYGFIWVSLVAQWKESAF